MNRLLLLCLLLLTPGCALVGLTERLNHATKRPYDAVLSDYDLPSAGSGTVGFQLVATDGSGVVETASLQLEWWPEPGAWEGDAPPPAVRTSEVVGRQAMCCFPSLPALIGGDFRPDTWHEVELNDGAGWRPVGSLPPLVEPPHPARVVLHDVLLPLAYAVDVVTSPVQLGVFALVLAFE